MLYPPLLWFVWDLLTERCHTDHKTDNSPAIAGVIKHELRKIRATTYVGHTHNICNITGKQLQKFGLNIMRFVML